MKQKMQELIRTQAATNDNRRTGRRPRPASRPVHTSRLAAVPLNAFTFGLICRRHLFGELPTRELDVPIGYGRPSSQDPYFNILSPNPAEVRRITTSHATILSWTSSLHPLE